MKIHDLETNIGMMGSTRPSDHPNYFTDRYLVTIKFSTEEMPNLDDRETLSALIETLLDIQTKISKKQSPTTFVSVK